MIYIVNGFPGSGKTLFENYVCQFMSPGCGSILSTIDPVKKIATICGWNGEKTPESRKFLSDLKNILTEFNGYPREKIIKEVNTFCWESGVREPSTDNEVVIFIDCREPKEIKWLCDKLGAKSILVTRPGSEGGGFTNSSDANVMNYEYDIKIPNEGTKKELIVAALNFIKSEGIKKRTDPFYIDLFDDVKFGV